MGGVVSQFVHRRGENGFGFHTTAEETFQGVNLQHKTALITGATSGIGLETARALALHGAEVVIAARNVEAGERVKASILEEKPDAKVSVLEVNLSSLASVRQAARSFHSRNLPLHILINNAGVLVPRFIESEDGIELQFATNHLGHFLLTKLLLDTMIKTAQHSGTECRIVNVASQIYRIARDGIQFHKLNDPSSFSTKYPLSYAVSKLANILHAKELARRLKVQGVNVTANAVHPGVIRTNIIRLSPDYMFYIISSMFFNLFEFYKTTVQGAATTCYVATNPRVTGVSGQYFVNCNVEECVGHGNDMNLASELWEFSEQLTAITGTR